MAPPETPRPPPLLPAHRSVEMFAVDPSKTHLYVLELRDWAGKTHEFVGSRAQILYKLEGRMDELEEQQHAREIQQLKNDAELNLRLSKIDARINQYVFAGAALAGVLSFLATLVAGFLK